MTDDGYPPMGTKFMRTDVRYMSKHDLFVSSRQFLLAGALCAMVTGTAFMLAITDNRSEGPNFYLLVAAFVLTILTGMGTLGGIYLAVRAVLRSSAYDPGQVWKEDQEAASRESNL